MSRQKQQVPQKDLEQTDSLKISSTDSGCTSNNMIPVSRMISEQSQVGRKEMHPTSVSMMKTLPAKTGHA